MPDVVRHCAVLGDPIAHSLSPALHRAGYQAIGLDWSYDAHRVPEGQMAGFVAGLDATWRGLSVTAPLKREALALADAVSPQARLTGAANTLLLVGVGADRRIHADNTDLPGAVAAVRERFAGEVRSATVIGAGATAASTGLALAEMGATSIRILARDAGRAATTVAAIAAHPAGPTVEVAALDSDVLGEVVVSTIPAAAQDEDLVARCAVAPVVFEVICNHGRPRWPPQRAPEVRWWSPGSTCSSTKRLCSSSPTPVIRRRCRQCGRLVRLRWGIDRVNPHDELAACPGRGGGVRGRWRAGAVTDRQVAGARAGSGGSSRRARQDAVLRPGRAPDSSRSAVVSAVVGAVIAAAWGWDWLLVLLLPLVPVGVLLSVVDGHTRLLPKVVVLPATAAALCYGLARWAATGSHDELLRGVIGLVATRTFFWLLWFVRRAGMGFGDVRLAALLGCVLGYAGWSALVVGLYASFLLFAVPFVVIAIARRDRSMIRRAYPFGPFLLAGAWVGLIAGDAISRAAGY